MTIRRTVWMTVGDDGAVDRYLAHPDRRCHGGRTVSVTVERFSKGK
jgi:hypothetical protein